jgi:hypothetical protein
VRSVKSFHCANESEALRAEEVARKQNASALLIRSGVTKYFALQCHTGKEKKKTFQNKYWMEKYLLKVMYV